MYEIKRSLVSKIVFATVAIAIILALAYLFYYFAIHQPSSEPESITTEIFQNENLSNQNQQPAEENAQENLPGPTTSVIIFKPPEILPTEIKNGACQASSIISAKRDDAWQCAADGKNYDPCFTAGEKLVYCKTNPLDETGGFLVQLKSALPEITPSSDAPDNWAWFIELEDGTALTPYTGKTRLVDGEIALYGSKIVNGERIVLIGDLAKGQIWTARKKVLMLSEGKWVTKSSETVWIKTIWQ